MTRRRPPTPATCPAWLHSAAPAVIALGLIWPLMILVGCKDGPAEQAHIGIGGPDSGDATVAAIDAATSDSSLPPRPDLLRLPPTEDAVVVPFGGTATLRLDITTNLRRLDVLFLVDTTASMGGEIEQLQTALSSNIIPPLRKRVPDVAFGVARFEDFPISPFGAASSSFEAARADEPFTLLSPVTLDENAVLRALRELDSPLGWGGDGPESGYEALYQAATGEGFKYKSETYIQPFSASSDGPGELGGVGFRQRAMPAIVHITDAPSHVPEDYAKLPGTRGFEEATQALRELGARVIGVASGRYTFAELTNVAIATDTVVPASRNETCDNGEPSRDIESLNGYGCPLVYGINEDGTGLSDSVVTSLATLVENLKFDEVRAVVGADPNGLVQSIVPLAPTAGSKSSPEPVDLRPLAAPDGVPDTYLDVITGTGLSFEITLHNDHIAPSHVEQSFRVLIQVLGDGWTVEQRYVRIVIPPWPFDGGLLDAEVPDAETSDAKVVDAALEDADILDAEPTGGAPTDASVSDSGRDSG